MLMIPDTRHPSVRHFARLFDYEHLPVRLQPVSKIFHDAAQQLVDATEGSDNPEVATSLRKLLEAKDCAVRADGLARGFRPVRLDEEPPAGTPVDNPAHLLVSGEGDANTPPPSRWSAGVPGAQG